MDAKITKQRLSNLLAYDWLKILVTIVVAVLGLILIFTMTATRPTSAQTFAIYAYTDLRVGTENDKLMDNLQTRSVFSYDILSVTYESFAGNSYATAAFTARRAAGEGTVMFTSARDGEGKYNQNSELYKNTFESMYSGGDGYGGYYNPQYFLETEINDYLVRFFGSDLTGELDADRAAARFLERNGKDKRFRSEASKQAGIESEKARLVKLRDDFLIVRQAFQDGKLAYTALNNETGDITRLGWGKECPEGSYIAAFDMSALKEITKVYYFSYTEPETEENKEENRNKVTGEGISLTVFKNSRQNDYDLCYECVSLLSYLAEHYA